MNVETCRSCNQPVVFARHERTHKPAPINAAPSADGDILIFAAGDGGLPLYRLLPPAKRFGRTDLRVSHFANCPKASRWRR